MDKFISRVLAITFIVILVICIQFVYDHLFHSHGVFRAAWEQLFDVPATAMENVKDKIAGNTISAIGSVAGSIFGALAGGIVAIIIAFFSPFLSKFGQREDSKVMLEIIDTFHNDIMTNTALLLIDYGEYPIQFPKWITDGSVEKVLIVNTSDMIDCLRVNDLKFSVPEVYIRDCFDKLFVSMTKLSVIIERGDIRMKHADAFSGYYMFRMWEYPRTWDAFERFLLTFHYEKLHAMLRKHHKKFYRTYVGRDRKIIGKAQVRKKVDDGLEYFSTVNNSIKHSWLCIDNT